MFQNITNNLTSNNIWINFNTVTKLWGYLETRIDPSTVYILECYRKQFVIFIYFVTELHITMAKRMPYTNIFFNGKSNSAKNDLKAEGTKISVFLDLLLNSNVTRTWLIFFQNYMNNVKLFGKIHVSMSELTCSEGAIF